MNQHQSSATTLEASLPCRSDEFRQSGFAVLRGLVDDEESARLRSEVDAALRRPRDPSCARPNNTLVPLRWCDAIADMLLTSERRMDAIRRAVGAADLRWISGYVSVKDARSAPLWWHQDWWCWDHAVSLRRQAPQVAVLFYLTDADSRNGALRVVPGSHHRSLPIHATLHDLGADDKPLDPNHPAFGGHPEQVTLDVEAGDAVVMDYRLLHGTHANASDQRRDGIIMSFTPGWRDLPEDIRAHLISHCAQPLAGEITRATPSWGNLLPVFDGARRDLTLNRVAPAHFEAR